MRLVHRPTSIKNNRACELLELTNWLSVVARGQLLEGLQFDRFTDELNRTVAHANHNATGVERCQRVVRTHRARHATEDRVSKWSLANSITYCCYVEVAMVGIATTCIASRSASWIREWNRARFARTDQPTVTSLVPIVAAPCEATIQE